MLCKTCVLALFLTAAISPVLSWSFSNLLVPYYRAALVRSPELSIQAELVTQAEERFLQSGAAFYPQVTVSETPGFKGTFTNAPRFYNTARIGLIQPVFRGFRLTAQLDQFKSLSELQKEMEKWARAELYLDTLAAFSGLLALSIEYRHQTNQIAIYDRRITELRGRVAIGRARRGDLLSVQSARAIAYSQSLGTLGSLEAARGAFSFITGMTNYPAPAWEKKPNAHPPLSMLLASLTERPDYRAAQVSARYYRLGVLSAQAALYPWLDFSAGLAATDGFGALNLGYDFQLTLSYPLFNGGATDSKIREAESMARQYDKSAQAMLDSLSNETRNAYTALRALYGRLSSTEQALELSGTYLRETEAAYRLGTVDMTELLAAEASYENVSLTLDTLRVRLEQDYLRLLVLSGHYKPGMED